MRRLLFQPAVLFLLAAGAVLVLYGGSLGLWWCCDDPAILLHAHKYSPAEYFADPAAWRALVPYSLTPWLSFVYDVDLALFGFRPMAFFAHHLLTLALCAWLLHRIAARWVGDGPALVAPLLFLVGVPVALAAQQLMVRQYLEGLLFYLLALQLVIHVLDGGQRSLRFVAAVSFAVAVSAKEVFLPLGFVPFLLPLSNFRQRLGTSWPWVLVMALYVPWRWYMLGAVVGGYTPAGGLSGSSVSELAGAFINVPASLWSAPAAAGAGLAVLGAVALHRSTLPLRSVLAWLAVLAVCLLAPLLPLVRYPGLTERYFIVPWAALALVSALAFGQGWAGQKVWLRCVVLAAMAIIAVPAWLAAKPIAARGPHEQAAFRELGIAYLAHDAPAVLWGHPAVPSWFYTGLEGLRPAMGRTAARPTVIADESELIGFSGSAPLLRYDAAQQAMRDVTGAWPSMQRAWRERLDASAMEVSAEYDPAGKQLRWKFEPATGGSFALISGGGALAMPAQGHLRMDQSPSGCFRIRLERPQSRLSYSPLLAWPSVADARTPLRLSWKGNGDLFLAPGTPLCPESAAR